MESFTLSWRFLLEHPATPYIVPMPWHLLAVLAVLGLFAAGGLHHLLGHNFRFYKVPGGVAAWLSLPSFVVLLVSVQVLIGAYLIAALAPEIVRFSLGSPAAQASAMPIGNMLLSPAFPGDRADAGPEDAQGLNRAGLNRALHAYSPKDLRESFRRQLQEARAKPVAISGAAEWDDKASPELFLLTLHWAAESYEDWPPQIENPSSLAREYGGSVGKTDTAGTPTLSRSILSLVEEIGWESDLARRDWSHVAGNRFIQRVLAPQILWQVRWLAAVSLILMVAANLAVFFLLGQLKRMVYPPQAAL